MKYFKIFLLTILIFVIMIMEVCMKKYSLLKAIGIITIIFMLLTWIVPTSLFTDGNFVSGGFKPMGVFDLLGSIFNFFSWGNFSKLLKIDGVSIELINYTSLILGMLSIGIFYKVLNKTGAYGNLVEDTVNKLTRNKIAFIIGTIVFFTLVSSLTGLSLLLFLLVPFFITVLLKLNFSRITTLATTILPILIGRMCSITAWDVTGINNTVYNLVWNDNLLSRIIILFLFMVLTTGYILISKSPKDDSCEDPMYDNNIQKNRSYIPLVLLTAIFFIVMSVCMYNWYYVFGNTTLTEAYDTIMTNSIAGYPFVNNLLGNIEPFGYWSGFTMSALLLLLSILLSFIYSISFNDFVDATKKGVQGMMKTTIYIVFASLIITFLNTQAYVFSESENIFYTISNWINKNISIEPIPFATLTSIFYGLFVNDYAAVALQTNGMFSQLFTGNAYSLAILTFQLIYGLVSIIAPTSIFLVAGLAYLDVSYKKWLLYIWKLILSIFIIGLLLLLLVSVL